MALSEDCQGRLHNWKFEAAAKYLPDSDPTDHEHGLVNALAAVFGNSGWFDGRMGTIVSAAVSTLTGDREATEENGGTDLPADYRSYVDHLNGDPYNNDPDNLRVVKGNERR